MYRIRLETGEETEFNSFEELSFGIVSGIVGAESQIYHERAEKWLPIKVHPEYKRAVGAAPVPPAAAESSNGDAPPAGLSGLVREADPHVPERSDRGEGGGLDLLTLLDLEGLAQGDSGKVQESAVPHQTPSSSDADAEWVDPADWIGDLDEPEAPATEAALEAPEPEPVEESQATADEVEAWEADPWVDAADDVEPPEPVAEVVETLEPEADDVHVERMTEIPEMAAPVEGVEEQSDREDVDFLGEMLESGDADLTTQALDVEEIPTVSEEPESDPEPEAVGMADSSSSTADQEDGLVEAPADDSPDGAAGDGEDYEFSFQAPVVDSIATPAPVFEDPIGAPEHEPADPESPAELEPAPSVAMAAAASAPASRRFDVDFGASEARGGLRDLIPFDLPKPAVLGGIIGAVALVALFLWMFLRPGAEAVGTDTPAPDSAVVVPVATTPRPAVDLEAQRRVYTRAYAQSGSVLEDEVRRSGINYLFNSSRFASEGDMLAARRAISAARTAVVGYRGREDSLQRLYPDADPPLRESRVSAELADDILSTGDGIYGLLLNHLDDYAIRNGSVTFTDPRVEASYTRLLRELDRLLTVAGEAQTDQSATLRRVFDAVDATRPPPLAIIAPPPPLTGIAPPGPNN